MQVCVYSESVFATPPTPRFMTLEPGDVVLTGTPPGVGCFKKPPLWLKVTCAHCLAVDPGHSSEQEGQSQYSGLHILSQCNK